MRLSALAVLTALLPAVATAQPLPIRSGLPWASGTLKDNGYGAWRGRPVDVQTRYLPKANWDAMRQSAGAAATPAGGPRSVVGVPMLPSSHAGQLAPCANGAFDANIRTLRDAMLANGGKGAVLRLGWEANRYNGFPWAVQGDGKSWAACFRRWVNVLNPVVNGSRTKNFLIVWNMANKGVFNYPINNMWPGNEYVDMVGSQFYDRCPPLAQGDEAGWVRKRDAIDRYGNPAGPGSWLKFAQSKGKPYAMPEWGIGGPWPPNCSAKGTDSPFAIRKLFEFFQGNAASIGFEAYFNGAGGSNRDRGTHELFVPSPNAPAAGSAGYNAYVERYNPKAAAEYRRLWGSVSAADADDS